MQTRKHPLGAVHLKHNAIPRHITRTASGIPPVAVRSSKPAAINYIRIYGNTINEAGVGDATLNLSRPSQALPVTVNGVTFSCDNGIYSISGTRTAAVSRAFANMSCEANLDYTILIMPLDGYSVPPLYLWSNNSTLQSTNRNSIKAFTANASSITIAYSSNSNSTPETSYSPEYKFRMMAVKGTYNATTMPEYEPPGYKIPVTLQNSQSTNTAVIYLDRPLYSATDHADITDGLPELDSGLTTVSTDTLVLPSKIELSYSVR